MMSTAYLWHNYGKSTIGSRSDIEKVPPDSLRAFYKKYYQPDNAVLVIAGKFDEAQALATVGATFGVLAKPQRTLPPTYTVEPVQDGERSVTLRRNGDVNVVGVAYHGVGGAHPDFPALQALADLLDREPAGRLYKALVETKLAAEVHASMYQWKDPGLLLVMADVPDGKKVDRVRDTLIATIEKVGAGAVSDQEVERWRNATLKDFELSFANSEHIAVELSEWAALGDWRLLFAWRDRVKAITADDVRRVARDYLKPSNRTVGLFVPTRQPERAPLPDAPDIAAIVDKLEDKGGVEKGEEFAATIENIESHVARAKVGALDAAYLAKKTRGGKVTVGITLRFGDDKSLRNSAAVADLTGALIERGTAKHTYQQLEDEKDRLKSHISIRVDPGVVNVDIDTLRDQLPAALDLVAEMLKTPSFPAGELEIVRNQLVTQLEQQQQDPQVLASIEAQRTSQPWPADDPRAAHTPSEQIAAVKKVTLADIKAFHRDFFAAGKGEIAVVGDFDRAAVEAKLGAIFAGWKAKKAYARLGRKLFDVAGTERKVDTRDKEMAIILVGQQLALRDDSPDYPALVVLGEIVGGYTGSRVWMRLREREGLSYGAGLFVGADSLDPVGTLFGYAILAPQNLAKGVASILDEIRHAAGGAVTEDELARAKGAWLKQLDTNLSNDQFVRGQLADDLFTGRTLAWTQQLRTKVQAVSAADVARVAKQYLKPDRLIVVQAGDMNKAAPAGGGGAAK